MKEHLIQEVQRQMLPYLNNAQLKQLKAVLEKALTGITVHRDKAADVSESVDTVSLFITAKRIEGCSEKTLNYYRQTIFAMLSGIGKLAQEITTEDLRRYLADYQTQRKSSKVTIDNIRRILSSYFSWMEDEDHIVKSPVRRIHKVKTAKVIKETYSDETLEIMRDNCSSIRDLAMIDLLASSGMRVGEMSALNRDDINFNERECVVFGKGSKERIVYFDARTKIHLQNYLESRSDSNPALFVSLASPHGRLQIGGIERRLRELGRRLDLPRVHPHKFRRTLATSAIDKGMPIEQVQQLLGHQKIDTTMHYAMVKQQNVKLAHRKYIGGGVTMKEGYRLLGDFIRQVDVRNTDGKEENLLGVSVQKMFIPSIANTVGTDFTKYKVVKRGQFTYIPDTSRRGDKIGIALLTDYDEGLVSNIYTVFEVKDENELLPEYLMLWFSRPEFDRYARFKSHGSVREIMDWDEMCKVELPVPSIEKQRSIVKAYNTITDRIELKRKINDNLAA